MAENKKSTDMIEVLVISSIRFNREHTEEGRIISMQRGEAEHLEACGKVKTGTKAELAEEQKAIRDAQRPTAKAA